MTDTTWRDVFDIVRRIAFAVGFTFVAIKSVRDGNDLAASFAIVTVILSLLAWQDEADWEAP